MKTMDEARKALSAARQRYLDDLEWLRREYGIIPDVESYSVKAALLAALDALEKNDLASLETAVGSFSALHNQVMRYVVWDLLERTKIGIKSLRKSDPTRKAKIEQWNKACWEKHPWITKGDFSKYRETVQMLARL